MSPPRCVLGADSLRSALLLSLGPPPGHPACSPSPHPCRPCLPIHTRHPLSKVPKKVTTCTFTPDGRHALAADKFGDVLAVATERPAGATQEGWLCVAVAAAALLAPGACLGWAAGCPRRGSAAALVQPQRRASAAARVTHRRSPLACWPAAPPLPAGLEEGQQQEPEILLGHYCAILTSLSLSAGGRLLATTDR